ncbi:MAG TPA: hypothetical protein VK658_07890, partial [Chryseolinea sp.]|nr:hypothetical protein [Chryseolinea sp.]
MAAHGKIGVTPGRAKATTWLGRLVKIVNILIFQNALHRGMNSRLIVAGTARQGIDAFSIDRA